MQGYGYRRRARRRVRVAWAGAAALMVATAALSVNGCSIVSDLATPDESRTIIIPGTDALTTESSVAATASTDPSEDTDSETGRWDDYSYGHVINVAPRADAQRYHRAAKSSRSPLTTTSGFHFSTPDRAVQCSTGANGTGTLSCVSRRVAGPPNAPTGTPSTCKWNPTAVTLGPAGPAAGACSDLYPVMTRSTILPFGEMLAVGRFKCLNSVEGMFCIQSTGTGFAITTNGFREIRADQRAPKSLRGPAPDEDRPTRSRPSSRPTS
ncbi:hypothetical protein [Gordonia crocea]|uniref:Lipoprotein LppI n=1 Tax=Gordonia crocea TaxID=589162 RepID=A0A7I9V139_9ACTN|nr:hypothetical protein [Gordonia crocea]GED98853.1 hypothetical protein nbrc107697_28920 [Gordonia crocea]